MPHQSCNGIDLYFERTGSGPERLLIHGLGGDARMWGALTPLLQEHCTVIALDLRGSGRSAKPDIPYTMTMFAEDTAAFIETVCTQPVHVLGFSLGGCIAMQLAMLRPELVHSLTLVSTLPSWHAPFPPSPEVKEILARTDMTAETLSAVYRMAFGPKYRQHKPVEEYIRLRLEDTMPQPIKAYLHQLHALKDFDIRSGISRIDIPTHILAGLIDTIVPKENAQWLSQHLQGSTLTLLEDIGHMFPLEAPEALAQTLVSREENA